MMAEAAIIFVIQKITDAVAPLAVQKASSLVAPLLDVHSKIIQTQKHLEVLRAFLRYADACIQEGSASSKVNQTKKELVLAWVKQVKDVTFEIEDIIDEYTYLIGGRHRSSFTGHLYNAIYDFKNLKAMCDIAIRLKNANTSLQDISKATEGLGIKGLEVSTSSDGGQQLGRDIAEHAQFIDEREIVGLDEQADQLVSWLRDKKPQCTVRAIWGMGGVGKTTLASRVHRSLRISSHFECSAWVSVSQTYTREDLLRRIIEEVYKPKREAIPNDISTMSGVNLVRTLQTYLQDKRYLIILDYVWHIDAWGDISDALIHNDRGSRVIITTRNQDVALIAPGDRIINLEPLQENEAWTLFCTQAFQKEKDSPCPPELEYWGRRIVSRCDGLPLAIATIANVLARKEKTELAWKSIYDGLVWEEGGDTQLQKVSIILNFSINDLPYYLKNCFLYCSIFPEDYTIKRKELIRLWVANGFIEKKGKMSLEEVAEDYLNQLIGRCMLQPTIFNWFGRVRGFQIHDVVRELIVEKSRDENIFLVPDNNYLENNSTNRVRRLSITNYEIGFQLSMKMPRLRSLHVFSSTFSYPMLLSGFRLLRILDLHGAPLKRLPDGVVCLFNLRYLSLRGTMVGQLPKAIGRLRNLETLDACETCLTSLPRGITKLEKLRHLSVSQSQPQTSQWVTVTLPVDIPRGIWNLKGLQTLKAVTVDEETSQHLGNLTQIRTLDVHVTGNHFVRLFAAIVNMKHLVHLNILADRENALRLEALSPPPPHLLKLRLQGTIGKAVLSPWLGSLANLKSLQLSHSRLEGDSIIALLKLCNLGQLSLLDDAYDGEKLCFRTGWFPKLKLLQIHTLQHLRCIEVEGGALASLTTLDLAYCRELKMLPEGIENLIHLERLELEGMADEFVQKLREGEGSSKDRHRVQHIPLIRNWVRRQDGGWDEERFA